MKVIVCGAGQVGYGIAERLAEEGNDVTVVDHASELVERINDTLDVRGILGHASHPEVLEEAGANDCDMIIAVTRSDEVNMVACQVAHSLFSVPTRIARVRAQSYLADEWKNLFSREHLPIDVVISPEIEVGEAVLRRLYEPGAFETVSFADGKVSVMGISCGDECPVVDTPIRQLSELFPDLGAVIVAVYRGGRLFVPHASDQLLAGDDVYVIAPDSQVARTLKIFGHEEQRARRVVIVGGGNVGLYVAERLEASEHPVRAKVIEKDRARAVEIAERLTRTIVLNGDGLSEELLREADVAQADTILALTNDDQVNILTCVLARQLGSARALCLVNSLGYVGVIRSLGIDTHINPRAITVSRILQQVRRGRIQAVHSILNGAGEIIEALALETAPVVGKPLRNLDLSDGVRVGAILRDGEVIRPSGDSEIRVKDRVVLFATAEMIPEVEQMFRVSVDYF